ncbi:MAG: 6-bladed beta-propeller [Bacteroides sp.]|nr:6-bladed beta-propeller [Bacteroides sp.]
MKPTATIAAVMTAILAGCSSSPTEESLPTIDLSANLPTKEIFIEDIADVTFTPLETTDSFITRGNLTSITDKHIAVANNGRDGELFIFDRTTGRAISHINRKGQGAGDYTDFSHAVLSNHSDEIYIVCSGLKKIMVYDLKGNLLRELPYALPDDRYIKINSLAEYDADHLLAFLTIGSPRLDTSDSHHAIISKADGTITQSLPISITTPESSVYSKDDFVAVSILPTIGTTPDGWAFFRISSDTIFTLTPDRTLTPLLTRTPSIHTSDPQTFLYPTTATSDIIFLVAVEKTFDIDKMEGFPSTHIAYDRNDRKTYSVQLKSRALGPDYTFTTEPGRLFTPTNPIIAAIALPAETLRDLNLSQPLKTIVETLDEEANPVIMIATAR